MYRQKFIQTFHVRLEPIDESDIVKIWTQIVQKNTILPQKVNTTLLHLF